MVFSSLVFLYLFLPLALGGYFLVPRSARNAWLLATSVLFYVWGEGWYVLVMGITIVLNWGAGLIIDRAVPGRRRKIALALAVAVNLALLVAYKYANFLVTGLAQVAHLLHLPEPHIEAVHLPIGISFFTFQAISYVVDVYRQDVKATGNLLTYATYKAFFPQLIAGPIIRYRDVANQLTDRPITVSLFAQGVERFAIGLAKKALLANLVAGAADHAFSLGSDLDAPTAWWGILCYSLQIYFDFSGYSDMAIGMGMMFGFRFNENFSLPYTAVSIRDFWRRWHISLSTWFRDYLYIPLGGSRGHPARVCANLFTVFLLCGLWHGASWTFVIWGAYHGFFIALEHAGWGQKLERLPKALHHVYTLMIVGVGWVMFRADDLPAALLYLTALAGFGSATGPVTPPDLDTFLVVICGCIGAAGLGPSLAARIRRLADTLRLSWVVPTIRILVPTALLAAATIMIICNAHNPFIYFRF